MTDRVTIERETLERALDAVEAALSDDQPYITKCKEVCTGLRAALAAQPAEPVAWVEVSGDGQHIGQYGFHGINYLQPGQHHLYAAPPAPAAVPPGYALVPIEPTHGMLSALTQEWHPSKHGPMKQRYRAMIAAAGDKPVDIAEVTRPARR